MPTAYGVFVGWIRRKAIHQTIGVTWPKIAWNICGCLATLTWYFGGKIPDYRRNWVEGGTYFFTVNLLKRKRDLFVTEIDFLRKLVRRVKRLYPFEIVAWLVLPDHMHCIWMLPTGDSDYATRWRLIKLLLSKGLPKQERFSSIRKKA